MASECFPMEDGQMVAALRDLKNISNTGKIHSEMIDIPVIWYLDGLKLKDIYGWRNGS